MIVFASQAALEPARASVEPAAIDSPARVSVMLSIYTQKAITHTKNYQIFSWFAYFLSELVGGNFYCDCVLLADLFIFTFYN